jgi:hypothetical protein
MEARRLVDLFQDEFPIFSTDGFGNFWFQLQDWIRNKTTSYSLGRSFENSF